MLLRLVPAYFYVLLLVGFSFLLHLSCSKDHEVLRDAILTDDAAPTIQEEDQRSTSSEEEDQGSEDSDTAENTEALESRITLFPAIQDAYIQNGQGFDQNIVRLQENYRRSYLMFDLGPIDSIGGEITSARLEFIINSDDGHGVIIAYLGSSSDWSEKSLAEKSAPNPNSELGKIEQEYPVDATISIDLKTAELTPGLTTLILEHENGNDLAFASKEHTAKKGPKLIVTYDAPISADAVAVDDSQVIEESAEEVSTEEDSPEEDTTEEDPAEENTTEEDSTEDDTIEEDTTEEDTTEEDTTEEDTTEEEDTPEEEPNSAPVAVPQGTPTSGAAPLEVAFRGNNSTDDKAVTAYIWNFKDGSSATTSNPSHVFNNPGTYVVELTVKDAEGLTDMETITITVNEPPNEAPVAVASANITSGTAPLQVNFTGSSSTDDKAIDRYLWNFKDGSTSNAANPSHTFNSPGTYYVDLFVYDAEGLSDFAGVTINVENPVTADCSTQGGYASTTGLKTWCWGDITIPTGDATGRDSFSNGQLALNTECNGNMVLTQGSRLKFVIDPTKPAAQSWCSANYNFRSEIRTMPWNVDHPPGTEEWIGFDYKMGDNYIPDPTSNWIFYQAHEGTLGTFPLLSLQVNGVNTSSYKTGEIIVVNGSQEVGDNTNSIYATNVIPNAGDTVDVVLHIIWGDENTGLLEVWLNGVKKVDLQTTRTIRNSSGVGGNSKFGIYYSRWRNQSGVEASEAAGVTRIESEMGPLRMITRRLGDADYRQDSYALVAPR